MRNPPPTQESLQAPAWLPEVLEPLVRDGGHVAIMEAPSDPSGLAALEALAPVASASAPATSLERVNPWTPPAPRRRPPMSSIDPVVARVLGGAALIAVYVGLCLAPLIVVSWGRHSGGRQFLVEFSVGLGYVGLSMLVLQFALVSRISWLAAPFGIDVLHRFHKQASYVALIFVFLHPVLLCVQSLSQYMPLLEPIEAPWRARFAEVSLGLLCAVVALSVWRLKLRIPYELWKMTHGALSTLAIFAALAHINGVAHYTVGLGGQIVFDLVAGGVLFVLVWSRIISPLKRLLRPWRVVQVIRERGRAVTMVMEPVGHAGLTFKPGQFAWLTMGTSPFALTQHPFSFSSPGVAQSRGQVAVTIKALGDWTQSAGVIEPGAYVYMDGPHGSFSIDLKQAPGYVLIAAGVGITPIYSMISTMCLREDPRPAILFYSNQEWENVTFREQLDEMSLYMDNLKVVHVLGKPHQSWHGEMGYITSRLLRRHLPPHHDLYEYFVCGPDTMMLSVKAALEEVGVPAYRVHSERFASV
jgi:predicted ferric reductase